MRYYTLGLMSGTSLDGLDLCYSAFEENNNEWKFNILATKTLVYSDAWLKKLKNSFTANAQDLAALHSEYGFYLAYQVADFLQENKISKLDVIGSHGHTVFHQPQKKFTTQIGDGRAIKIINKIPVVYDFRSQDVLLGGNGAPLVPIGDELLFTSYEACLNLGGFSNISFKKEGRRLAFDICPVNILLNEEARKLGKNYDEYGYLAKSGKVDFELLQKINQLEYFQQELPKSLGWEWIENQLKPLIAEQTSINLLATYTEHAAMQIAKVLEENQITKVLCTGGGAYNSYLLEKIKEKTKAELILPSAEVIDFKEALIFGFMALLRLFGRNNVLASVTGASQDHSSGILS